MLPHSEPLQAALLNNLTSFSMPQHAEPAQHLDINSTNNLVRDLDVYPYLKRVESIADWQSQPLSAHPPQAESYPSIGAPLSEYCAEPWECDAHGCLLTKQ